MKSVYCLMVLVVTMISSGCSTHYLVTSKFGARQKPTISPPEIVQTPTYKSDVNTIKSVAVRAPSSCSNKTLDQQKGSATSKEVVLATQCAVEMSMIERALSMASYKVISWTEFDRDIDKNVPIHQLANKMGAQILFQINSLEKSTRRWGNLSKDTKLEYTYYISNDDGEILGQAILDDDTKEHLKAYVIDNTQISNVKVPFVTLDANAISTKDGEAIWFYRWTYSEPSAVEDLQKVLVDCNWKKKCNIHDFFKVTTERNSAEAKDQKGLINDASSLQPEDKNAAVYSFLLTSVIDNFVNSFSTAAK